MIRSVGPFWILFLGIVVTWLVLFLLSFATDYAAVILFVVGMLVGVWGGLWSLYLIGQNGNELLLCLLIPFYQWYYIATNWEEQHRPVLLSLLGAFMSLSVFGTALGKN